jgi:hypothetical protein
MSQNLPGDAVEDKNRASSAGELTTRRGSGAKSKLCRSPRMTPARVENESKLAGVLELPPQRPIGIEFVSVAGLLALLCVALR